MLLNSVYQPPGPPFRPPRLPLLPALDRPPATLAVVGRRWTPHTAVAAAVPEAAAVPAAAAAVARRPRCARPAHVLETCPRIAPAPAGVFGPARPQGQPVPRSGLPNRPRRFRVRRFRARLDRTHRGANGSIGPRGPGGMRRQSPPGIRISGRAFGRDWRYPITSGYRPQE